MPIRLKHMNRTVDVILGLTAAVATALLLTLIARDDIGMPPDMVREDALIGSPTPFHPRDAQEFSG
jgi:hypothetical protein